MSTYRVVFEECKAYNDFLKYLKEHHVIYDKVSNKLEVICSLVQEDIRQAILLMGHLRVEQKKAA